MWLQSVVHNNLISPNPAERVDAARHLGLLACGDSMVLYALRERLRHDQHERVVYEATKSLITLGLCSISSCFTVFKFRMFKLLKC